MYKLSVAIATYNGAKYLREQLNSLYSQTKLPDEVVVSDDCSTDETLLILEEYRTKFGLKYFSNDHNIGFNKNFESALSKTSGDFIMICDQDDIWSENKIEVLYEAIVKEDNTQPVLICSETKDFTDGIICRDNASEPKYWRDMLLGAPTQGCTSILNRVLLNSILPIDLPEGLLYDAYLGLTAAMTGIWCNIGQSLMLYRHHNNNVVAKCSDSQIKQTNSELYPQIIADKRFLMMEIVKDRHSQNFVQEHVWLFEKILNLSRKKNKLSRIVTVLAYPNKSIFKKFISIRLILAQ